MNDMLRQEIIDDLGLGWCVVINDYVDNDCFNHCSECSDWIAMNEYYSLHFAEGDEPF